MELQFLKELKEYFVNEIKIIEGLILQYGKEVGKHGKHEKGN